MALAMKWHWHIRAKIALPIQNDVLICEMSRLKSTIEISLTLNYEKKKMVAPLCHINCGERQKC